MNRNELRRLARIRLKEARVLLRAKCFDGAYYLCGYAVECGLKACIAKITKRSEFPDLERARKSWTHDLSELARQAGIEAARQAEAASDPDFGANWIVVKDWSEKARYALHDEIEARSLYQAVAHREHGVMQWLRKYW